MKLVVRDRAYDDLRNIRDWIARDRPMTAADVISRLLHSIERLAVFPRIGRKGRALGTLEWIVPGLPFIVVYAIDDDAEIVVVIAVFHTARERPEAY